MSKILKVIAEEVTADDFLNILPASQFIPEWYRRSDSTLPGSFSELLKHDPTATTATYKKCIPFFDALTAGYMAFLTTDIEIIKQPNGAPYFMHRSQRGILSDHSMDQWKGLVPPKGYSKVVLKWHSQVSLETPPGYSLLFTNPINRFDLPFQTVTGIVDTDKFDIPVHFPFFIRDNFTGIIEKGTPITQIIPIKRDSWIREEQKFDSVKTATKYEKFFSTIKRSYKTNYWTRKEYK